jgi:hypothetical protein
LNIKINTIIRNNVKPKCDEFLYKIESFNSNLIDHTKSMPYINNKIKESRNFYFGLENKSEFKYYYPTNYFYTNINDLTNAFIENLTIEEIKRIRKDKNYYIKNENLRKNLTIFNNMTLLEKLNNEEKGIFKDIINKEKTKHQKINSMVYNDEINNKYYEKILKKGIESDKENMLKLQKEKEFREKKLRKIQDNLITHYNNIKTLSERSLKDKINEETGQFYITQQGNLLNNNEKEINNIKPKKTKKFIKYSYKNYSLDNLNNLIKIRNNKIYKIKKKQEADELIREATKKIKESYEYKIKKDNISNLPKI